MILCDDFRKLFCYFLCILGTDCQYQYLCFLSQFLQAVCQLKSVGFF